MLFKHAAEIKNVFYAAKGRNFRHGIRGIGQKVDAFIDNKALVILLRRDSHYAFEKL